MRNADMIRKVPIAVLLWPTASASLQAAELRPVVLHPGYRHDRFDTQPKDIVRHFRAFTSSFDSDDDDNGDSRGDRWAIPEWVAYELRRAPANLGRAPRKRPSPLTVTGVSPKVGMDRPLRRAS